MGRSYYVYILTNNLKTVLYIGMTNNLQRRLEEHRSGIVDGFSKQYQTKILIHFEAAEDVYAAIGREKQLKGWSRKKKEELIERRNPYWRDLSEELFPDDQLSI